MCQLFTGLKLNKSTCIIFRGMRGVFRGEVHNHEHIVFKECKALKKAATSISTHDNLLFNPVLTKIKL